MSKSFGLPGLRIGWLVTRDQELRESLVRMKDYTSICSSGPGQFLARVGLQTGDRLLQRNRALVQGNLEQARAFMKRWERIFGWREPQAGPVALVRLLNTSAEQFCREVRQQRNVLLVPSGLFDFGDSHFRLGLGRSGFDKGLAALEPFLEETQVS